MSTRESGFCFDAQAPPFFLISTSQPDLLSKAPPTHRWAPPIGGLHTAHDNHLFCNTYLRSRFQPFYDNYFLSTLINNKSAANYFKNRGHKEARARTPPSHHHKPRPFTERQVRLRTELYIKAPPLFAASS